MKLDILALIYWLACFVVLIVLFIKSIRDHKEFKKRWAELDKEPAIERLGEYRIVKAQTAHNGEKYFVEFYHAATNKWITLDSKAHDMYESALEHKEGLERAQRFAMDNVIVAKEIVK